MIVFSDENNTVVSAHAFINHIILNHSVTKSDIARMCEVSLSLLNKNLDTNNIGIILLICYKFNYDLKIIFKESDDNE